MEHKFENQRSAKKFEGDNWNDVDIMDLKDGDTFKLFEADGREVEDGPFIATGAPVEDKKGQKTIPMVTNAQHRKDLRAGKVEAQKPKENAPAGKARSDSYTS